MKRIILICFLFCSCHSKPLQTTTRLADPDYINLSDSIVKYERHDPFYMHEDTIFLYVGYNASKTGSNHTVYGYFIQWWTEYPTMSQIKKQIRKSDKSIKGLKLIILSVIQLTKDQVKNLSE
jgi:hypothetical protein